MPTHNTELVRQLTYAIATDMTMHIHTGAVGTAYTSARVTGDPTATIGSGGWGTVDATATEVEYDDDENFGVLSTTASITVTNWTLFRGVNPAFTGAFAAAVVVPANTPFQLDGGTLILDADSLT